MRRNVPSDKGECVIVHAESVTFPNTIEALRFAFAGQNGYERPLINRMTDTEASREGLSPVEAAAQAGMMLAEIKQLGPLTEQVLRARYMRQKEPCTCRSPCCSGKRIDLVWDAAVSYLTQAVAVHLEGCKTNYKIRRTLIEMALGCQSRNITQLAADELINRDTLAGWRGRVKKWLDGAERRAYNEVHDLFKARGRIET